MDSFECTPVDFAVLVVREVVERHFIRIEVIALSPFVCMLLTLLAIRVHTSII
jgi:hypothetical protein